MALFGEGNLQDDDPRDLSSPQVFLLTMIIFLIIAGFVILILSRQVTSAFYTNPGLNGLIIGVLAVGILLALGQVVRLFREVRWVNSYRTGLETARDPVLLSPMRTMLSRSRSTALSAGSMRSLLDSLATRLDEARDISRYLIGLLVFLGLLGTFWGLLQTIGSIGATIQSLEPNSASTKDVLDSLKTGLQAPLSGMGTAFSSSLFGLSGSLILGFLDLQAGRAQNRFYVEVENWLSTRTDIGSDLGAAVADGNSSDALRVISEQIAAIEQNGGNNPRTAAAMANLAEGISALVKNMRSEQQMIRDWIESQSTESRAAHQTLKQIAGLLERQAGRQPDRES